MHGTLSTHIIIFDDADLYLTTESATNLAQQAKVVEGYLGLLCVSWIAWNMSSSTAMKPSEPGSFQILCSTTSWISLGTVTRIGVQSDKTWRGGESTISIKMISETGPVIWSNV